MPGTIYESADAAARDNKLERLLFIWQVQEPNPVAGMADISSYESKIAALVPYMENESIRISVIKMREEISRFLRKTLAT